MRIAVAGLLLLVTLGGCATRGALNIECASFDTLRHDVPFSKIESEIHSDLPRTQVPGDSDMIVRMEEATAAEAEENPSPLLTPQGLRVPRAMPGVLMLSGGGQWGAYGAGFLDQMRLNGALPRVRIITGVSTGALQSLFVAVGTPDAYAAMLQAYDPARESDIVDRGAQWTAIFTGSIAGLKPLQRKIEDALCPDAVIDDPTKGCMLDVLKGFKGPHRQRRFVLIGFVEASSGKFQYVDAVEVAQLPRREARQCLTGAALASAAMPVFFQPVQINGVTYYDGGVRASVFEANVAASAERASRRSMPATPQAPARPIETRFPIYVVRNGSTVVEDDPDIDKQGDALSGALRAEAIVVNQLEVGSIAAIRLEHPSGPLRLTTADGYTAVPCEKPRDGTMFDRAFMNCLTRLGRTKANSGRPWIELSPLGPLDTP
ncbi:MAG: patatin-like phospholipase family protein [Pseudomonadota bacterium]